MEYRNFQYDFVKRVNKCVGDEVASSDKRDVTRLLAYLYAIVIFTQSVHQNQWHSGIITDIELIVEPKDGIPYDANDTNWVMGFVYDCLIKGKINQQSDGTNITGIIFAHPDVEIHMNVHTLAQFLNRIAKDYLAAVGMELGITDNNE